MSQSFKPVPLKRFAQLEATSNDELRFWKQFRKPITIKQIGSINHVSFSQVAPHNLAVTTSARVVLYNGKNLTEKGQLSRFKDIARCGTLRDDGKLLLAGCDSGVISLYNASTRSLMKMYRGHKGPVHAVAFSPHKPYFMSVGDDTKVNLWEIAKEVPAMTLTGHTDYVRCVAPSPSTADVWATGSYDHTVKIWNTSLPSTTACTLSLDHGAPVMQVMFLHGGGVLASAGGNYVKLWDMIRGGTLLATLEHHQKTITTMCLDATKQRMITGGLDGLVKIYDISDFKVAYSFRHQAPVTSVALCPENKYFVIGSTDGSLTIRQRNVLADQTLAEQKQQTVLRGGTYKYFMRGQSRVANSTDVQAEDTEKPKMARYDKYLKRFQYGNALTSALNSGNPVVVMSVVEELNKRGGLRVAISNRDEASLEPLISFLVRYTTFPRYSRVCTLLTDIVIDLYSPILGQSFAVDGWFARLKKKIDDEVEIQQKLLGVQGALDALLSAATTISTEDTSDTVSFVPTDAEGTDETSPQTSPIKQNSVTMNQKRFRTA